MVEVKPETKVEIMAEVRTETKVEIINKSQNMMININREEMTEEIITRSLKSKNNNMFKSSSLKAPNQLKRSRNKSDQKIEVIEVNREVDTAKIIEVVEEAVIIEEEEPKVEEAVDIVIIIKERAKIEIITIHLVIL